MNDRPTTLPTTRREAIDAYADAHAADPGHNLDVGLPIEVPAAPPATPPTTDLAKFIFDTMTAANRALAEQIRQGPR